MGKNWAGCLRRTLDQAMTDGADLPRQAAAAQLWLPGGVDGAADYGQPAGARLSELGSQ